MKILGLQETDWLKRGPHTQHHIFERLSKNSAIKITVLDYDMDKILRSNSLFIKKHTYSHTDRAVENSNVNVIRTAHLQVPYLRRISSLITNFFEILKFIRRNRPDIIIGFSVSSGIIGLLLAKIFRIPYIFYCIDLLHTLVPISFARDIARIISRFLFKFSDQTIVVTRLLRNYVLNEGVSPDKVKILLNGISLENTIVKKKKFENLKNRYSITDDDFVIFFMGYLYDFAGLKEIIDYYNNDVENGKINLKFIIVGDGGIYNYLVKYVNDIKADWVIFTGRVPFFEITEYMELADLCLMSFKLNDITKEITPVKVMEYMAMKKPVLSNNLPSVVLEIGKDNGVIFTKNQRDLIEKIGDLASQKTDLKKIGQRGYNLIKKYYVWPVILKDLKKIMIQLIEKKRK